MKFGVVIFPGSNCDMDMIYVLEHLKVKSPNGRVRPGEKQQVIKLWHKDHDLQDCDFIILPGGFSYGDYLRSGAIARFSPIMNEVMEYADKGGNVLGVCNGFQILCESHLLPGALLSNDSHQFLCKNVYIKAEDNDSLITAAVPSDKALKIPIAHAEGKFYADKATLKHLNENGQVLFRYCDENGSVTPESNPNGALENIAGICNDKRNVFGMMPHPERASDRELGNIDGSFIFDSILSLVNA